MISMCVCVWIYKKCIRSEWYYDEGRGILLAKKK